MIPGVEGRVAIVGGSSAGLGYAVAELLAWLYRLEKGTDEPPPSPSGLPAALEKKRRR